MQTSNCDTVQQEISAMLDEGGGFSEATIHHLRTCAECARFLDFCVRDRHGLLDRQLPFAGSELHAAIVAFAVPTGGSSRKRGARGWWLGRVVSIAAAAAVVMWCAFWMVEVRPAADGEVTAHVGTAVTANQELVALQADLHQGAAELRGPLQTLRTILNQ